MPKAACLGEPLEVFFGEGTLRDPDEPWSAAGPDIERATSICDRCPVRAPCLAAGLREAYGVWGGLAPADRRRLRRKLGQRALHQVIQVPG